MSFDFRTAVDLFVLTNLSCLTCCITNSKKKKKAIEATNKAVSKQLDALQIIKNAHYLHYVAKQTKTACKYDYEQQLNLESDDSSKPENS